MTAFKVKLCNMSGLWEHLGKRLAESADFVQSEYIVHLKLKIKIHHRNCKGLFVPCIVLQLEVLFSFDVRWREVS